MIAYSRSVSRRAGHNQPFHDQLAAKPGEKTAEKRRRHDVEDELAENDGSRDEAGDDQTDNSVWRIEASGKQRQRHRRKGGHATAQTGEQALHPDRAKLAIEVHVPAAVELDAGRIHEECHHRHAGDSG
jgi:hypothetical protein